MIKYIQYLLVSVAAIACTETLNTSTSDLDQNVVHEDRPDNQLDQGQTSEQDQILNNDAETEQDQSSEELDEGILEMDLALEEVINSDNELPTRTVDGLPIIHDFTGAPEQDVNQLIQRAIDGLGMSTERGPESRDRIFVGRWYMAWLDETGFYGKMNALWLLNGDINQLDFRLLEGERPVNVFAVGERGQGVWPGGYMGAEHIEVPNRVPEEDDQESCGEFPGFCAQYSHSEASRYTNSRIPTWQACNEGSPSWDQHFAPYSIELINGGLRIMYEGPLTKRGDFGGSSDGRNCHEDWLFDDGIRRRVYLRVGYELKAEDHSFDRLMQVNNPVGNPTFETDFSFIGGFVMTSWPAPFYLKELNRFIRVDDRQVQVNWQGEQVLIDPLQWTALPEQTPDHDVVLGHAQQAVNLSPFPYFQNARTYTLSNHGIDNGDSGFCLCTVHGGLEMGGGLISIPVAGGELSHVAQRRLTISDERPLTRTWVYEAESDLSHGIGRIDTDGWSASTHLDSPGSLAFGPYTSDWGVGHRRAYFRMLIDVSDESDEALITIDINDATLDEIMASRVITRADFDHALTYQDFDLAFNTEGRAGHLMETRVTWHDRSYVRLDRVLVEELF